LMVGGKRLWGKALREHMKRQKELQIERLKAGRFFNVTCEKGHTMQMSGIDLCRRLDFLGEKIDCPECYEKAHVSSITEGEPMTEEQKKQQQEEYLRWSKEKERERDRKEHERIMESGTIW